MKDPTQDYYRLCFQTEAGKKVLGQILVLGGYFDSEMQTTEELAVLNFVRKILKNCGFHPVDIHDGTKATNYVNNLFNIGVS